MTLQSETSETDAIRQIEAAAAPTRFARGWHCLGLTRDFGDGEPHACTPSARSWSCSAAASADRRARRLLPPHGRDLSQGKVKGDEIACPFHDWRWGGDGRCGKVPYSKRTPRLARTATWTTLEQVGMLFVWNDPERDPPPPEVAIPRMTARRVTTGPIRIGTAPSSTPTAARSSTTSSTWRTSSTSTGRCRTHFRTSSKAMSPRST